MRNHVRLVGCVSIIPEQMFFAKGYEYLSSLSTRIVLSENLAEHVQGAAKHGLGFRAVKYALPVLKRGQGVFEER